MKLSIVIRNGLGGGMEIIDIEGVQIFLLSSGFLKVKYLNKGNLVYTKFWGKNVESFSISE